MYKIKHFYKPFLFHATSIDYIESIKEKGLIIGYAKSPIPDGIPEDYDKCIWLDSSPFGLEIWLRTKYKKVNWQILAIPTKRLDISKMYKPKKNWKFYMYFGNIKPDYLFIIGTWEVQVEPLIKNNT